jgi:MarR family transcriptional regulator, transcriptional regulator for hemolysin
MIERAPHPTDRRASLISLTKQGRARLPEAQKLLQKGADQAVAGFSGTERATFIALLKRVVTNLDERAEDESA